MRKQHSDSATTNSSAILILLCFFFCHYCQRRAQRTLDASLPLASGVNNRVHGRCSGLMVPISVPYKPVILLLRLRLPYHHVLFADTMRHSITPFGPMVATVVHKSTACSFYVLSNGRPRKLPAMDGIGLYSCYHYHASRSHSIWPKR